MNQRAVDINGKKLILTERPAVDVQDVFDFLERSDEEERKTYKYNLQIAVWIISQSLRSTRNNISFWRMWRRLKYYKYNIPYLARKVSPHILFDLQNTVLDLDELNKKKVVTHEEKKYPG